MNLRKLTFSAAAVTGMVLAGGTCHAQNQTTAPASPYGGTTVEGIVARVNDQVITKSDYDRAQNELDQDARQRGQTLQQISAGHKDLLRNLIDQQLWLSKGKELGITGETELIKRLDDIRKQSNLASMEDLEKAAKEQGVSYEDFKANIRNNIITQEVMRNEVGAHLQMTPGEVERYYELHKQDYQLPESERLSEILVSTGENGTDDAAKVTAAKAKADDIEARLHAGGDFAQVARSFSDGTTAASGGDLGEYKRGQLPKVIEDKAFALQAGGFTEPILTRQGYIILKVIQHTPGGPRPFKDVEQEVEEAYYMSEMEPAIRAYLTKMRNDAFIYIMPGYTDTAATDAELHSSIVFSAYVPPAPKKKAKAERTRFRESTHAFRQKGGAAPASAAPAAQAATQSPTEGAAPIAPEATAPSAAPAVANPKAVAQTAAAKSAKSSKNKKGGEKEEAATEKPGKREKIRYGRAPRETLPTSSTNAATENAGALPETETASNEALPANPLEPTAPEKKTRFSAHARDSKKTKGGATPGDANAIAPPDAGEVADRQVQSAPLGGGGDTSKKKKKEVTANGEKTRLSQEKKKPEEQAPKPVQQPTPIAPVPGAPAPAETPAPANPGPSGPGN